MAGIKGKFTSLTIPKAVSRFQATTRDCVGSRTSFKMDRCLPAGIKRPSISHGIPKTVAQSQGAGREYVGSATEFSHGRRCPAGSKRPSISLGNVKAIALLKLLAGITLACRMAFRRRRLLLSAGTEGNFMSVDILEANVDLKLGAKDTLALVGFDACQTGKTTATKARQGFCSRMNLGSFTCHRVDPQSS